MTGLDLLADTNFLIAVHEGDEMVESFLDQSVAISVISEIELLGFPKITEEEKRKLRLLLRSCEIILLNGSIKDIAINFDKHNE